MDLPALTLVLLGATVALHVGHTGIHLMVSLVWRSRSLPSYDAAVGYLAALSWFALLLADRGTIDAPMIVPVVVGLPMTALGLYVHSKGILDLTRHRGEGPLVTVGIYSRLRHPIYYGWVLVSFGMPLALMSLLGLVSAPVWSGLIVACGVLEERDLRTQLPEGVYESYARDTWL